MRSNPTRSDEEQDEERPPAFRRVEQHIQSKILAGLLDLVPTIVTIIVVVFLVQKVDALIRPLPFVKDRAWDFPAVGLIVSAVLLYFFGLVVSTKFGSTLSGWKDDFLGSIPVIRNIFGVTRQVMSTVSSQYSFSRVVFLEWPREGMVAMGFVTGRAYSTRTQDSMAIVYIPTIPNPTSGNMALVMEDDLLETDLSVEEAMKLVFSGGIVLPEELSLARIHRTKPDRFELTGRFTSRFPDEPYRAGTQ